MNKLRVGVIGCGWVAYRKHLPQLSRHEKVEIAALCDIDRARAEQAKKDFGLDARIYEDYRALCADKKVDCVYVLTPNGLHADMCVAALEGGKHVLCEKPLATRAADAERVVLAAKKAGRKLTVGHQWRFRPHCLYIKGLCERGLLGDIYYVKALDLRRRSRPSWGQYMSKAANGGGIMMDGAPHTLDAAMWFLDNFKPLSVSGRVMDPMRYETEGNPRGPWDTENCDVEDTGFALITMEGGAVISLEAAWGINMLEDVGGSNCNILCGTKGGVDMQGRLHVRVNGIYGGEMATLEPDRLPREETADVYEGPSRYELDHWIEAIERDTEPLVTGEEALAVVKVLEAVYRSSERGETIHL